MVSESGCVKNEDTKADCAIRALEDPSQLKGLAAELAGRVFGAIRLPVMGEDYRGERRLARRGFFAPCLRDVLTVRLTCPLLRVVVRSRL